MKLLYSLIVLSFCSSFSHACLNPAEHAEYDELKKYNAKLLEVTKVVSDSENVKELRYAYEMNPTDKEARDLARKWKMPEEIIDRFAKLYKKGRGLAVTEEDFKEDFSVRAKSPMSQAVLMGLQNEVNDLKKKE